MNKEQQEVFNLKNTQTKTIKELVKGFQHLNNALELESQCKNQVYHFILENDLFDKFNEWNKNNPKRLFS